MPATLFHLKLDLRILVNCLLSSLKFW